MELVWSLPSGKVTFHIGVKFWNRKGSRIVYVKSFSKYEGDLLKYSKPRRTALDHSSSFFHRWFLGWGFGVFFLVSMLREQWIFSLALPMERVKAEVLELAEGCNCFSSSKEAPWPLALKSCFKDESYTKRHFEFLLPQAQRSYVDLSCRLCWRRNYLNCTDLRDYMAGMCTMNMQPKYLWVFWLTLGLTLVSLLCISCSYLYWGSGWKICHCSIL